MNYNEDTKIWKGPQIPFPYSKDFMFGDLIFEKLNENLEKVIQICADDDSKLTCGELKISSIRAAQNLLKLGIKSNDVIGFVTHQSHLTTILINAAVFIGVLINPLDEFFDEKDIRSVFEDTKPRLIICDESAIEKVKGALKNSKFPFVIYSTAKKGFSEKSAHDFLLPTKEEENFKPLKFPESSSEKILCIMCTSGTTGSPKGACVTHELCLSTPSFMASHKHACLSPLYWSTGFYPNFAHVYLPNSNRIFTKERFNVPSIIKLVEKYKITVLSAATYILGVLLNSEEFLSSQNQSLQTFSIGGAIVSTHLRRKFAEIFPDRHLQVVLGMTELGRIVLTKPNEYKIEDAVGSTIVSDMHLKIVDKDGKVLEMGKPGEIYGRNTSKFLGYYDNEVETKKALDQDGFLKTGDLGYFNNQGVLCLIDRKKEILKHCGYHVNPSEIENLIQSMDGVEDVCVVGVPDLHQNNLIAAAIVRKKNSKIADVEVEKFVESKNPWYKHLHAGAFFFEKLPMTPSGKIMKRVVREEIFKLIK